MNTEEKSISLESIDVIKKIEKQIEEFLYCIQDLEQGVQYYTKDTPIIESGKILITNYFSKGRLIKKILNEEVICEYKVLENTKEEEYLEFDLTEQVELKYINTELLSWLDIFIEDAEKELKEKVLETYEDLIPAMMNKINKLEKMTQQDSSPKRQSDLLKIK